MRSAPSSATTAAVITEVIQGEGGVRVPPPGWLSALRRRCDETGALLVFDEIQSGMGRTGRMYAFEHADGPAGSNCAPVVPDILTLAKAFGGGMPIGAFVASPDLLATLRRDPPLSHVTTFGGHPVSCAAALATLGVLASENLPARAVEIEARVRNALTGRPLVDEVRGRGAMLGLNLTSRDATARVVGHCLAADVLLGWTLHSDTLIRIAPPLTIPWDVLDAALAVIVAALEA